MTIPLWIAAITAGVVVYSAVVFWFLVVLPRERRAILDAIRFRNGESVIRGNRIFDRRAERRRLPQAKVVSE